MDDADLLTPEGGLIMAAAQFAVALVCLAANQREIQCERSTDRVLEPWRIISIVLMLLSFSSLMHGETLLPGLMREVAHQDDLYEWRRIPQFLLLVFAIPIVWKVLIRLRQLTLKFPSFPRIRQALNGLTLLLTVLALRVVSFHYTDDFVDMEIAEVSLGRLCEWLGLGLIAHAAAVRLTEPEIR